MADGTFPEARAARADEAFVVQVLRYLDGRAAVQDLSELKEALATRPACRALFVRLCRLHGELSELLAPLRAATETAEAPHPARPASPRGDSESPPAAGPLPARADAPSAVSVADRAGGPDVPPTGDTPGPARPPDETAEYVEDAGDETTH
jgi:anti-sigma factor RsiW